MALHDMLKAINGTPENYAEALRKVKPLLEAITKTTRVIWYSTYTTVDLSFEGWIPRDITQSKIRLYNEIVRQVLQ